MRRAVSGSRKGEKVRSFSLSLCCRVREVK